MDGVPLEPVTMVSALPPPLALSAFGRPSDGSAAPADAVEVLAWYGPGTDARTSLTGSSAVDPLAPGWSVFMSAPDGERASRLARCHARWRVLGYEGYLLAGATDGLLEALPDLDRRRVGAGPGGHIDVPVASAGAFIRALFEVEEDEGPRDLCLVLPPGARTEAGPDSWASRIEFLWHVLNRGTAVLITAPDEAGSGGPPGPADPSLTGPPATERATVFDHVPPVRARVSAPSGLHTVPTYAIIVDGDGTGPSELLDGVQRLLSEVLDGHVHVSPCPDQVLTQLDALFPTDPRLSGPGVPIHPATPYVVHVSPDVPLTAESLRELVAKNRESEVSITKVLLAESGDAPRHLSLLRTAAVRRLCDPDADLLPGSEELSLDALDAISRTGGFEWLLPDHVGLATAADNGAEGDLLGASAAMPADELDLVSRLQTRLVRSDEARRSAEEERDALRAKLDRERSARRRTEEKLTSLRGRKVVRMADWVGRVRAKLTR
jgi:hypothetical protein